MKGRSLLYLILVGILISAAVSACGGNDTAQLTATDSDDPLNQPVTETLTTVVSGPVDTTVHTMVSHIVRRPLSTIFCDTNDLQLTAAIKNGINPIQNLNAYNLNHPLVKLSTCDAYALKTMWHSMPYLVPRAQHLLHDIGQAFSDTIKARGGKDYRIFVTSALRTEYSVRRLKRFNRAATEQSCHRYGTTFDVSWTTFDCRDSSYVISLEDLKNILAEIIYQKREQGRCYAMFERRQGCFHITVR